MNDEAVQYTITADSIECMDHINGRLFATYNHVTHVCAYFTSTEDPDITTRLIKDYYSSMYISTAGKVLYII